MKLSAMSPPQWATVSASIQPGSLASQLSARMGTSALMAALALGVRGFLLLTPTLRPARTRSICAGLMASTFAAGLLAMAPDFEEDVDDLLAILPWGASLG